MKRAAITNECDSNKKRIEWHSNFSQEIIDMIVDNLHDKETLGKLCKVSPSWERAALTKLYSKINLAHLVEIGQRPYLANFVKEMFFWPQGCRHCDKLKNIEFPKLKEMYLYECTGCDHVQQLCEQTPSIQHLGIDGISNETELVLSVLKRIIKARIPALNYQPLLSYSGPLDKTIASCLQKLGTRSINGSSINCENIVPYFSQFSNLQDISLNINDYEEDILIEGLKHLSKFKSLSSFKIYRIRMVEFSQNVSNALVENILKPNATTLQKVVLHYLSGFMKLPLDQHWPNLKKLAILQSKVDPMSLINFCEKAPNIQDILIHYFDEEILMQNKVDFLIKIINSLKKLSSMTIYIFSSERMYYSHRANGAEIRYIQCQNVDETLRFENGEPKTRFLELKEEYKNKGSKSL